MMDICGFPKETRAKVCHVIEQLWKRKQRRRTSFTSSAQGKTGSTSGAGPLPSTSPSSSGSSIANAGAAAGKPDNKLWTNMNKYLLKITGVTQKAVDMLGQFLNVRGTDARSCACAPSVFLCVKMRVVWLTMRDTHSR
jgi:hypothetical protein